MDPVSRLGLALALILAVAKVGGHVAARWKQPSVLGELVGGILLGGVPHPFFQGLRADPSVDMLARLGVLILLFEVGLESTVRDVAQVGVAAARVAVLGTVGTLVAGWAAAALAVPDAPTSTHLFLGAAMTATSIGISARVLKDAGVARSREAHLILGAAVLDDILGLVALALVTAAVTRTAQEGPGTFWALVWLVAKTALCLTFAVVVGGKLAPGLFRQAARLRTGGVLLATGLCFCFVLAWGSSAIGLAPIVGAFTAGLILEDVHDAPFTSRGEPSLLQQIDPISSWLVPVFFVLMGMRADFTALAHPRTLLLVALLTVAAVLGKLACALGVPRGADRLGVAIGMIPRGEVSLVFASLGLSSGLLDAGPYSALVTVVVLTAIVTPALLRGRFRPPAVAA